MKPLRLIYDISLLGRGHVHIEDRTGLFRYAEEIFKEMIKNEQLSVQFTASQINFAQCQQYLKHNFPHLQSNLILPPQQSLVNKLFNLIRKIVDESIDACKKNKISTYFTRKIAGQFGLLPRLCGLEYQFLEQAKLQALDLYFSPCYAIPLQIQRSKIKNFVCVHDVLPILFPQHFGFLVKYFYQYHLHTLTHKNNIFTNSLTSTKDLLSYKPELDTKRVHMVYCGISASFRPVIDLGTLHNVRSKYSIPQDSKYILSLSSLNPRKNIEHLVRSFMQYIKQHQVSDLRLVLAGPDGWKSSSLFALIEQVNKEKKLIIVTGFVDEADLPALYSSAIAFCYMSHYEGFGSPVIEAMGCGIPVITSNNSSLKEIAEGYAVTLDSTDQDGLANAIGKLYEDQEYREELISKSRLRAANFSWKKCTDEMVSIMKSSKL